MPIAGDEGYEQLVICPYDKAHEIRKGRIQFHLDKCRKNHKDKQGAIVVCPYNSCHNVPSVEIQYHTEEDCGSSANWQRFTHEIGDVSCPVKDLVPVNAATVPDSDENWDSFESQGSVLDTLKTQAAEKNVFRMLQCESKSKRKKFRREEQLRHSQMQERPPIEHKSTDSYKNNEQPLPKPTKMPTIPIKRQDPSVAIATLNSQFQDLDLQPTSSKYASSETTCNEDLCGAGPPSSAVSECSYASASSSRPGTAMSSALSSATSRPSGSRPSTAMSIAASVNRSCPANKVPDEDGFCQIPIPGLGRGSAARRKMKE